jgi:hypothetical protein
VALTVCHQLFLKLLPPFNPFKCAACLPMCFNQWLTSPGCGIQRELLHVPTILRAVTDERVRAMQDTLRNVWTRFSYSSAPLFRQDVQVAFRQAATWRFNVSRDTGKIPVAHLSPAHYTGSIFEDDAFATILGFLHSKMPPRARRRNEKVVQSASAKVEVRSTWSSV